MLSTIQCSKCGNHCYISTDGTPICPVCGFGSSAYPLFEFLRFSTTDEWRAYQEAGHAVMAYLILKNGIADKLFALPSSNRELYLPKVSNLTIENAGESWAHPTFSLVSLTIIPIVLLAGYIVASQKYNMTDVTFRKKSKIVQQALGFCRAYVEEMASDRYRPDLQEVEQSIFDKHWEFAESVVKEHLPVIHKLAEQLLIRKSMPINESFEVIKQYLTENSLK